MGSLAVTSAIWKHPRIDWLDALRLGSPVLLDVDARHALVRVVSVYALKPLRLLVRPVQRAAFTAWMTGRPEIVR